MDADTAFNIEVANLVAICVELLLYGIYTCLFFGSLYIMFKKRKTGTVSGKVFLGATILMYIVASTHIALNLYRLLRGYIWLRESVGPVPYFFDLKRWDNIAHDIILCLMTWTGDALVIYRCFIIWNNNYYVISLPVILLVFSIAVNSVVLYWFTHPAAVSFSALIHWMNTIYPVNFIQNTLTTGLIAFRILAQHRASRAAGVRGGSPLGLINIVRILVESAMLYTVQLLVLIILYFRQHNAQFVVQFAVVPTIGIVFNLIAVRLHLTTPRTLPMDSMLTGISDCFDDEPSIEPSNPTSPQFPASHAQDIKLTRIRLFVPTENAGRQSIGIP